MLSACRWQCTTRFGDLIEAFNRMVASIEEQRSGLNDTLSLLDSMLANAPIGLAFFDRRLPLCASEPGICAT